MTQTATTPPSQESIMTTVTFDTHQFIKTLVSKGKLLLRRRNTRPNRKIIPVKLTHRQADGDTLTG
jgi:hypothetical protein